MGCDIRHQDDYAYEPPFLEMPDHYRQPNGYKPRVLDLSHVQLSSELEKLCNLLADNAHQVWASKRLSQGWSFG